VIEERALTQQQAGKIIKLSQPKLSQLLRGHWESYSLDRLTRYLNELGVTVRVSFENRPEWRAGDLAVAMGRSARDTRLRSCMKKRSMPCKEARLSTRARRSSS
jgi:transcriptional regulator with XRE-family HTH domain